MLLLNRLRYFYGVRSTALQSFVAENPSPQALIFRQTLYGYCAPRLCRFASCLGQYLMREDEGWMQEGR